MRRTNLLNPLMVIGLLTGLVLASFPRPLHAALGQVLPPTPINITTSVANSDL